jgi:hypothetical protein
MTLYSNAECHFSDCHNCWISQWSLLSWVFLYCNSIMLSFAITSILLCYFVECHYAKYCCAECHYTKCHYAECLLCWASQLSQLCQLLCRMSIWWNHYSECHYAACHLCWVSQLSQLCWVFMLNVILLIVVAPIWTPTVLIKIFIYCHFWVKIASIVYSKKYILSSVI